ncbi:hypothetical protein AB1Y20_004182 [Prymnesium parvum]|uniref:Uncharacterized protein n=1 Tax=Prymnesium parvum TaxID=97485 RepID=A0AB34J8N3_PRYPA
MVGYRRWRSARGPARKQPEQKRASDVHMKMGSGGAWERGGGEGAAMRWLAAEGGAAVENVHESRRQGRSEGVEGERPLVNGAAASAARIASGRVVAGHGSAEAARAPRCGERSPPRI